MGNYIAVPSFVFDPLKSISNSPNIHRKIEESLLGNKDPSQALRASSPSIGAFLKVRAALLLKVAKAWGKGQPSQKK